MTFNEAKRNFVVMVMVILLLATFGRALVLPRVGLRYVVGPSSSPLSLFSPGAAPALKRRCKVRRWSGVEWSEDLMNDGDSGSGGVGSWAFLKAAGRRCVDLFSKLLREPSFRQELLDMITVRLKSVFRNIRTGEAGRRGEEWLMAQLTLLIFITLGVNPVFVFFIRLLGLGLGAFGGYMMIRAAWILKENLSPFVVPVDGNYLVTSDLYEVVRHPQYGGLILFCLGISLVTNSCDRLIFTLALAVLLGAKADREDQMLAVRHPLQHSVYLSRTGRKFIPYLM